jgi:hypothetical protein
MVERDLDDLAGDSLAGLANLGVIAGIGRRTCTARRSRRSMARSSFDLPFGLGRRKPLGVGPQRPDKCQAAALTGCRVSRFELHGTQITRARSTVVDVLDESRWSQRCATIGARCQRCTFYLRTPAPRLLATGPITSCCWAPSSVVTVAALSRVCGIPCQT